MKKSYLSRRESIILSAIEIIDELGMGGLSTREIARRQEISDAALYKHFKSKEEIIFAILEHYSHFDGAIFKTVENNRMGAAEGIIFLLKSMAEYYENYPSIAAVLDSYEYLMHDSLILNKLKEVIDFRFENIKKLVIQGQKLNEISENYDPEDLTDTVIGIFRAIVFKWRFQKYNFALKEKVISATSTFLKASKTL